MTGTLRGSPVAALTGTYARAPVVGTCPTASSAAVDSDTLFWVFERTTQSVIKEIINMDSPSDPDACRTAGGEWGRAIQIATFFADDPMNYCFSDFIWLSYNCTRMRRCKLLLHHGHHGLQEGRMLCAADVLGSLVVLQGHAQQGQVLALLHTVLARGRACRRPGSRPRLWDVPPLLVQQP